MFEVFDGEPDEVRCQGTGRIGASALVDDPNATEAESVDACSLLRCDPAREEDEAVAPAQAVCNALGVAAQGFCQLPSGIAAVFE